MRFIRGANGNARWQPVLDGSDAEAARETVAAIATDLLSPGNQLHPGLSGNSGRALFFAYLAQAWADERYEEAAVECHRRALSGVRTRGLSPELYGGFAGIGWVDEHLTGRLYGTDDDRREDTDVTVALRGLLRSAVPWPHDYDLIGGLVGYGLYALEESSRPSTQALRDEVVGALLDIGQAEGGQITWHTSRALLHVPETQARYPDGQYNLGVAHGIPGVIGLLALALPTVTDKARAAAALSGVVRWLLEHRLPPSAASMFSTCYVPRQPPDVARTAWCYGDPGIATPLLLAARAVDDEALAQLACDLAHTSLARPFETSRVVDAGLCHGAAGLAQIAMRLYHATADPRFAELAVTWLRRVLSMRKPGTGIAGYLAWGPRPGGRPFGDLQWISDPSFLTGVAGIGLTLLAATSDVRPDWDRLLVLS